MANIMYIAVALLAATVCIGTGAYVVMSGGGR